MAAEMIRQRRFVEARALAVGAILSIATVTALAQLLPAVAFAAGREAWVENYFDYDDAQKLLGIVITGVACVVLLLPWLVMEILGGRRKPAGPQTSTRLRGDSVVFFLAMFPLNMLIPVARAGWWAGGKSSMDLDLLVVMPSQIAYVATLVVALVALLWLGGRLIVEYAATTRRPAS